MWILALVAWKRPRLALNIVMAWAGVMAFCAVVAGPARFYLRSVAAPVPYDASPLYDVLGFFAGLLVLAGIAVVLLERAERKSTR